MALSFIFVIVNNVCPLLEIEKGNISQVVIIVPRQIQLVYIVPPGIVFFLLGIVEVSDADIPTAICSGRYCNVLVPPIRLPYKFFASSC